MILGNFMTKIRTGPPVASLFALLSVPSFGLFTQRREAERCFPKAVGGGEKTETFSGTVRCFMILGGLGETIPTIMKGTIPLTFLPMNGEDCVRFSFKQSKVVFRTFANLCHVFLDK